MGLASALQLLWLIPLCGAIIALYMLRLRRTNLVVPSLLLWSQVVRDVQANAPFQKLRKSPLLLLQLIAAALLIFAVAHPFTQRKEIGGRAYALIVDVSASMGAKEDGSTRLGQARAKARELITLMKPGDQMLVLEAGARPRSLCSFTSSSERLLRAVEQAEMQETGCAMREAVTLARSLLAGRKDSVIEVVTDGGFPGSPESLSPSGVLRFHRVGAANANLGITAVDLRSQLGEEGAYQLFVTASNGGTQAASSTLQLLQDGQLVDAKEIKVDPGASISEVFDLANVPNEAVLEASLDTEDSLSADNRAYAVARAGRKISVAVVGPENPFLDNALASDSAVTVRRFAKPSPSDLRGVDVVLVESGQAPAGVDANVLLVQAGSPNSPVTKTTPVKVGGVVDQQRNHPAMRFVEFGATRWNDLQAGNPQPWAQEVVSGDSGALVVVGEKNGKRLAWVGFSLSVDQGAFPLTVAYPIFLSNMVRWLAKADDLNTGAVRTGQAFSINMATPEGQVRIQPPRSRAYTATASLGGQAPVEPSLFSGIVQLEMGDDKRKLAVNLADPIETNVAPRPLPPASDLASVPGKPVTVRSSLWPAIALVALALLSLEYWVFHRRAFAV